MVLRQIREQIQGNAEENENVFQMFQQMILHFIEEHLQWFSTIHRLVSDDEDAQANLSETKRKEFCSLKKIETFSLIFFFSDCSNSSIDSTTIRRFRKRKRTFDLRIFNT